MLAFHRGTNIMAHNSFPSLTSLFWEKSGDECVIAHEGRRLLSASPVISFACVLFAIRTPVYNNREMLQGEPGGIWLPEGTKQRLNTLRHKWLAVCEVLFGGILYNLDQLVVPDVLTKKNNNKINIYTNCSLRQDNSQNLFPCEVLIWTEICLPKS